MAKRSGEFELVLTPRKGGSSAYEWLYASVREQILAGRLRPGTRLPATRDLAQQLRLSRGTIVSAFDQLKAEGYLVGTVGSGTYVSRILPDSLQRVEPPPAAAATSPSRRRVSSFGRRVQLFPGFEERRTTAFRTNLPALDMFPIETWTRIATRRHRKASTFLLMGCGPLGYQPLREAIADYLVKSRAVRCSAAQIAIVSGVQEALDICARLFLEPGDRACMEDPGYPGAAMAFEAAGAKVSYAQLDSDGMRIVPAKMQDVRLVHITPAHQFPTGVTMSLARRLELIGWAHHANAVIFEDDYDSEFRYSSHPLPALQGLDPHGRVLFAGSFSKVLFPSLRLGYMVVPHDLLDRVAAVISITTRHAPVLEQAILGDFISEGHFGRHLRRMREVYAERLSVLTQAASERLSMWMEIADIEAGLQTVGWLKKFSGEQVARAAADRGIDVTPLSRYSHHKLSRDGLQLGFAPIDAREIRRGVSELAETFRALERQS